MNESRERTPNTAAPIGVAIIGAGYWGPNLLRNFMKNPGADVRWMCDLDAERASAVVGPVLDASRSPPTTRRSSLIPSVEAVVIATPAASHATLAVAAMEAGKHVMVEKPLATSVADGRKMVEVAAEHGVSLMCDHTYCYTPAVQEIRGSWLDGSIGSVQYIDSVRINLGLIRPDVGRHLGPRPARPVDPRLHPAGGPASRPASRHRVSTRWVRATRASGT